MNFTKLVFEEKFLKDGAPDPEHWTHEVGPKWANNELQCYTDSLAQSHVKDGVLTLHAQVGSQGCAYESARLVTHGKHSWKYGRFVISAKIPKGVGSWPAIWMLPDDIKTGIRWPLCGEIDIMEHVGRDPEVIHFSLHTGTFNHRKNNHRTYFEKIQGSLDEFHDYEMIWDEAGISFFVDGHKKVEFTKKEGDTLAEWPFDKPYYLILNVAVGGFWGGPVKDEDLPFEMKIRSIKIYQ